MYQLNNRRLCIYVARYTWLCCQWPCSSLKIILFGTKISACGGLLLGLISPPRPRLCSDFSSLTVRGLRTALPPLAGSGGFAPLSKEKWFIMRGGRGEGAKRMPHHPQQERAIVVATNHPLFFVLILIINASTPSSQLSTWPAEALQGIPWRGSTPLAETRAMVVYSRHSSGSQGKFANGGRFDRRQNARFRILQLFTHSNLPLDQHRLRDHNFKLGLFSRKRLAKNWKKHAFDACSTGSWLVAAFQGAVTIVRVIFSTVSPGLSPPQLLTDSTKN